MISVVIPSYNSENTIKDCLDSLMGQTYRGDYEVIVVDSSNDTTPRIIAEYFPDVRLLRFERKTDPGTARNRGIYEARGDVIAFTDADCVPSRDWLDRMASLDNSHYRAVGGVVKNGNRPDDYVGLAGYMAEFREFLPGQPRREIGHIPTCNIAYRKEVFDELGLFEGRYYPQEDLVFNTRIVSKGEHILLDPAIEVRHTHRSGFRQFLGHQLRIGTVTPVVLRTVRLPGAFIVRHPFPCLLLVPLLPFVKFFRTVFVFLRCQPGIVIGRPAALCVLCAGLFCWTIGFIKGIGSLFRGSGSEDGVAGQH